MWEGVDVKVLRRIRKYLIEYEKQQEYILYSQTLKEKGTESQKERINRGNEAEGGDNKEAIAEDQLEKVGQKREGAKASSLKDNE